MRLLLDTHAFIWSVSDVPRLSSRARRLLESPRNDLCVSVASVWEMGVKLSLGKLAVEEPLSRFIPRLIQEKAFEVLPVQMDHALGVASLPLHHRDPFDRMLIAQALSEQLRLVSRDRTFERYGVKVEW